MKTSQSKNWTGKTMRQRNKTNEKGNGTMRRIAKRNKAQAKRYHENKIKKEMIRQTKIENNMYLVHGKYVERAVKHYFAYGVEDKNYYNTKALYIRTNFMMPKKLRNISKQGHFDFTTACLRSVISTKEIKMSYDAVKENVSLVMKTNRYTREAGLRIAVRDGIKEIDKDKMERYYQGMKSIESKKLDKLVNKLTIRRGRNKMLDTKENKIVKALKKYDK